MYYCTFCLSFPHRPFPPSLSFPLSNLSSRSHPLLFSPPSLSPSSLSLFLPPPALSLSFSSSLHLPSLLLSLPLSPFLSLSPLVLFNTILVNQVTCTHVQLCMTSDHSPTLTVYIYLWLCKWSTGQSSHVSWTCAHNHKLHVYNYIYNLIYIQHCYVFLIAPILVHVHVYMYFVVMCLCTNFRGFHILNVDLSPPTSTSRPPDLIHMISVPRPFLFSPLTATN